MNENENITTYEDGLPAPLPEELPMEDKKKAINLQDLVFVRQYIDKKMDNDVPPKVRETLADEYYNKDDTDGLLENYYKKTETDDILEGYYKKTDKVAEAAYADEAGHAANTDNAILNVDDGTYSGFRTATDGVLRVGDYILSKKKVVFDKDVSTSIETQASVVSISLDETLALKNNGKYIIEGYVSTTKWKNYFSTPVFIYNNVDKSPYARDTFTYIYGNYSILVDDSYSALHTAGVVAVGLYPDKVSLELYNDVNDGSNDKPYNLFNITYNYHITKIYEVIE